MTTTTIGITENALNQHQNAHSTDSNKQFGKTDSLMSDASNISNEDYKLNENVHDENRNVIIDIIKTENDLAGFSILWSICCVLVIILRLVGHPDVIKAPWIGIFVIPLLICTLTWIFSYVITIYRRPNS